MTASETKQVLIVRRDLRMRRGKEIAQAAHASMMFLVRRLSEFAGEDVPGDRIYPDAATWFRKSFTLGEIMWLTERFKKVTCQVDSEEEIRELYNKAVSAGLEAYLIEDAGLTEFHGVKTVTALAIGPDAPEKIDPITGHLKLY